MGFFNRFFGSGEVGGHQLPSAGSLANPTDPSAFGPDNPGSLKPIRSVPVLREHRKFTPQEAGALEKLAAERKHESENFQASVEYLTEIEELDAKDQGAYRKYQGKVASSEVAKRKADGSYVQKLHELREGYAGVYDATARAEAESDRRIAQAVGRVQGFLGGNR